MVYTKEWVAEKWDLYNRKIWRGALPSFGDVEFRLVNGGLNEPWGEASARGVSRSIFGTYRFGSITLKLSTFWDRPEKDLLNTLLHEMCHVYEYAVEPKYCAEARYKLKRWTREYPADGHGKVFHEQARRVREVTGIDVTRWIGAEAVMDTSYNEGNPVVKKMRGEFESNADGVMFYVFRTADGKFGFARLTDRNRERWDGIVRMLEGSRNVVACAVYVSRDFNCMRVPEVMPTPSRVTWHGVTDPDREFGFYGLVYSGKVFGDVTGFPGAIESAVGRSLGSRLRRK